MIQLTESEALYLPTWEADAELDAWVRELDRRPMPWKTTTDWNAPRATECFHPSAIARYFTSQPCKVYLWQQLMGSPTHHSLGLNGRKRADMGTALHIMMDYYMGTRAQYHKYEYEAEKRVYDQRLNIVGHVDALTRWPFKQPIIWDYKSIASNTFRKTKLPQAVYIWQVNTYMGVLGIPICVILYVVKDSVQFFPVVVHFDQEKWDRTVEVLEEVIASCQGEPPAKNIGGYCKYCDYNYDCFPKD